MGRTEVLSSIRSEVHAPTRRKLPPIRPSWKARPNCKPLESLPLLKQQTARAWKDKALSGTITPRHMKLATWRKRLEQCSLTWSNARRMFQGIRFGPATICLWPWCVAGRGDAFSFARVFVVLASDDESITG